MDAQKAAEKQNLQEFTCGNGEALEAIVSSFEQPIYTFAVLCLAHEELAEAILAETFIHFCHNGSGIGGNVKIALFKQACRGIVKELNGEEIILSAEHVENSAADTQVTLSTLSKRLSPLPVEYRLVLVLREVCALSLDEIAEVVETPLAEVEQILRRARRMLWRIMQQDAGALIGNAYIFANNKEGYHPDLLV